MKAAEEKKIIICFKRQLLKVSVKWFVGLILEQQGSGFSSCFIFNFIWKTFKSLAIIRFRSKAKPKPHSLSHPLVNGINQIYSYIISVQFHTKDPPPKAQTGDLR